MENCQPIRRLKEKKKKKEEEKEEEEKKKKKKIPTYRCPHVFMSSDCELMSQEMESILTHVLPDCTSHMSHP